MAKRKSKLVRNGEIIPPKPKRIRNRYEVTIIREIEHRAVVEVVAANVETAKEMAEAIADNGNPYSRYWVEGDCLSSSMKVKLLS